MSGFTAVLTQEVYMERRAKIAEDEPRCETLRQENEALTVYLIKCRDTQLALLQTVKDMKQQRADLLQRKVRLSTQSIMRL